MKDTSFLPCNVGLMGVMCRQNKEISMNLKVRLFQDHLAYHGCEGLDKQLTGDSGNAPQFPARCLRWTLWSAGVTQCQRGS